MDSSVTHKSAVTDHAVEPEMEPGQWHWPETGPDPERQWPVTQIDPDWPGVLEVYRLFGLIWPIMA